MDRVVVSWSGGKDAAMALDDVLGDPDRAVLELLTTVNADDGRVTMHGVRGDLLDRQAAALDIDLRTVPIPADAPNEDYEARMDAVVADYERRGIDEVVFADLYLEDVREYRAGHLDGRAVAGYWPVWGRDTAVLAREFVDRGFRARVVCVDGSALERGFAGREYDRSFLDDLPDGVDPCGENGEFHTFVYDGPPFDRSVPVEAVETVSRIVDDVTYYYCDLVGQEE